MKHKTPTYIIYLPDKEGILFKKNLINRKGITFMMFIR